MSIQLAGCFLAVSLLNLTRTTWNLSYAILYYINYSPDINIPQYVIVVNPILYYWVTVVLFVLLTVIGFKKRDGLWSQQQQIYVGGPQQQHFYGGGQGQGVPTSQLTGTGFANPSQQPAQAELIGSASLTRRSELTGAGFTNPSQQPAQAELIGNASLAWRSELTGADSPNSNQQYYWTQYQQQPPIVQNQVTPVYEVAGAPDQKA